MICYVVSVLAVHGIARRLLPQRWAWVATAFFATTPGLLYLSSTAMSEPLFIALTVSAVYLLIRTAGVHHGLEREDRRIVPLDHDELEPVGEGELLDLLLEILEAGLHGRRSPGRDLRRSGRGAGERSREREREEPQERQA